MYPKNYQKITISQKYPVLTVRSHTGIIAYASIRNEVKLKTRQLKETTNNLNYDMLQR